MSGEYAERQLEGGDVKLIPVLLSGGVRPAIVADIRCFDLARDWAHGVDKLCATLR